ncbi:hypothetical protein PHYPSEUDO_008866 [Phytophthora pseudosyringae]|uniref:Uncharacterized protein n=1 Tax=Phytophthora pseudosyringae TaxID=221518 RepID=A0A8T1VDP6_9STRA|nr:hypothetical protein PHYPSEUDO_008866 [Phytophthora pseudosyringae]
MRTSPSTKEKRERRQSSVKKPPSTAETGQRTSKASADERIKAAPASPVTEGALDASLAASHNENTRPNDGEVNDGITTASRESGLTASDGQLPSQNAVATGNTEAEESAAQDELSSSMNPDSSGSIVSTGAEMTASTDERVFGRNYGPLPSEGKDSASNSHDVSADDTSERSFAIPRFDSSMQTTKGGIDPIAEDADGAIFTVLTNVVDKVAEQEEGLHSDAAGTSPDDRSVIVSPPVDQEDTSYDPDSQDGRVPEVVNAITELDGGPGSLGEAERGQEGQTELSKRHDAHQPTIVEDCIVGLVDGELILDSVSTEEIYEVADVEQPHAEIDAVEDNGDGTQECNDQRADEVTPSADSSFGDTEIDIEAAANSSEHNLDIENAENSVNEALNEANDDTSADVHSSGLQEMMNEESTETNPDEAIETLETVKDLQGTSVEDEYPGPSHLDTEAVDRVTESNTHYNERPTSEALTPEVHESPLDPPERGQTIAISDEEARAPDQDAEQPLFSNGADGAVPSVEHELLEQHLHVETDIYTYETGEYYDLNYTSAENATLEDEAEESVYQQGDNAEHTPLDQELVDRIEDLFLTYEQQVQQTEPAEVENTADYGDYYQDPFALSYEEQRSYDEYTAITGDQLIQEVEGSDALADVEPIESTIDIDTEAQDSTPLA